MPATPGNEAAYERALTMRAYYRDAQKTAGAVVALFSLVTGVEGWLYLTTEKDAFAFGALVSLALVIFGATLAHHHGKKVAEWEQALERIDAARRDRIIHTLRKINGERP